MTDIFEDIPEDLEDTFIRQFDEEATGQLSKYKRSVWQKALKWAFQQDMAALTNDGYAELVFEEGLMRLKFQQKLYDKFKRKRK